MNIEEELHFEKIFIQSIKAKWLDEKNVSLDVLRLDLIHPVISGNKWFKLKYYIKDAKENNASTIATFGGAYSNHILATAYACRIAGLKSIGIIRGEEPKNLSHTLMNAGSLGMELHFVNRNEYDVFDKNSFKNIYWIDEGGHGIKGAEGAKGIIELIKNKKKYSHIICAVGTGTTLAGMIKTLSANQEAIGISVMKNNTGLHDQIRHLLEKNDSENFKIIHDFHFGGYAKHTKELVSFMNETWMEHQLPTDFVYTAKTFFAIKKIIEQKRIPHGSSVLMIHTGGLQGNLSLPSNSLHF